MSASGSAVDPSGSLRGLQGGARVSGAILPDTATYVAGVEFWSLESPVSRPFTADSIGQAVAAVARDAYGVALGDSAARPAVRSDVVSLFGRFDYKVEQRLGDPCPPVVPVGPMTLSGEPVENDLAVEVGRAFLHSPDSVTPVNENLRGDLGTGPGPHALIGVDPNSCHCRFLSQL